MKILAWIGAAALILLMGAALVLGAATKSAQQVEYHCFADSVGLHCARNCSDAGVCDTPEIATFHVHQVPPAPTPTIEKQAQRMETL